MDQMPVSRASSLLALVLMLVLFASTVAGCSGGQDKDGLSGSRISSGDSAEPPYIRKDCEDRIGCNRSVYCPNLNANCTITDCGTG